MVLLFSPYLFCVFTPMAVSAEACGGASGPQCDASLVYANFKSVYFAASTSNSTQEFCSIMVRQENNKATITEYHKNGTAASEFTEIYKFTDAPNVVNITLESDPSVIYAFEMLYADYNACFVARFDVESVGCRLWIFDNATSEEITACMEGHAQVCSGTVYDIWDEDSCASILD
ncbi:uncharacterized protein LOC144146962 [Haemaphysalis longicornis]